MNVEAIKKLADSIENDNDKLKQLCEILCQTDDQSERQETQSQEKVEQSEEVTD
jgi:hypothetical protein